MSKIDSLKQELSNYKYEDLTKVSILNELGYEYWIIDPVQSIIYGEQARALAEILHDTKGLAFANRVIGVANWAKGSYDHGLEYLLDGLRLYRTINDSLGIGNSLMNIGLIYADRSDFELASRYYWNALEIFRSIEADERIATTYTKLATILIHQGELDTAQKFLDIAVETHGKIRFYYGMAEVLNRFGLLYMAQQIYDSAEICLEHSVELSKKIEDNNGIAKSYIELAEVSLVQNDLGKAEDHLFNGLNYARRVHSHKWLKDIYERLQLIARERGDYRQAVIYYDQYVLEKDSIFNEQTLNNIARLETELATAEQRRQLSVKEQEILILEQRGELQQSRIIILITLMFIVILLAALIGRNRQARARQKEEEANLKAEQAKQDLEMKNRELVSYTVNFVQKNQLFEEMMESISRLKGQVEIDCRKELIGMERTIKKHLQVDKDWEDFKLRFENLHSGFFDQLLEVKPNLSSNDLRLSALVKMNFSIKEISDMMGISSESVKTARYRLKKKLDLPSEVSINDFLNGIG